MQKEENDFALTYGTTDLKSYNDLEANRCGDTVYVKGMVYNVWDDVYDFSENEPLSKQLQDTGKASPFTNRSYWQQDVNVVLEKDEKGDWKVKESKFEDNENMCDKDAQNILDSIIKDKSDKEKNNVDINGEEEAVLNLDKEADVKDGKNPFRGLDFGLDFSDPIYKQNDQITEGELLDLQKRAYNTPSSSSEGQELEDKVSKIYDLHYSGSVKKDATGRMVQPKASLGFPKESSAAKTKDGADLR